MSTSVNVIHSTEKTGNTGAQHKSYSSSSLAQIISFGPSRHTGKEWPVGSVVTW